MQPLQGTDMTTMTVRVAGNNMRIAEGIEMLEITQGGRSLCLTALYDKDGWVLVDTGMPGDKDEIMALANQAGFGHLPLKTIVLTHQDLDHIGSLPQFLVSEGESLNVLAHEADQDAIDGKEPLLKLPQEQMAGLLQSLPEQVRMQFEQTFLQPGRSNVTRTITDGETLPFGGGVTVIHTPGHTLGHISLYHHASKTLIAGDSTIAENGELKGPNQSFTPDMPEALRSLKKYVNFDIENVICYHGGLVQGDIQRQFAALAE